MSGPSDASMMPGGLYVVSGGSGGLHDMLLISEHEIATIGFDGICGTACSVGHNLGPRS
jgi:hypothetical protein